MQYRYHKLPGVLASRVGYTGGQTDAPTYESVCARNNTHSEAVWIAIDPSELSFEELMRLVAKDPRIYPPRPDDTPVIQRPQTKRVVWAQNDEQAEMALHALAEAGNTHVPVLPAGPFYAAEDYVRTRQGAPAA